MDLSLPKSPRSKFEDRDIYSAVCLLLVFFIISAVSFHGFFQKWHFREPGITNSLYIYCPPADFVSMMEGSAHRPYVYRQLLPLIANWIDSRVPDSLKDKLYTKSDLERRLQLEVLTSPTAQSRAYFIRYITVYVLDLLSAWIALCLLYQLCRTVGVPPTVAALSSVIFILLFPFLMSFGGYMYDFPELAFLALAAWMALRFDGWFLLPVVALATLNKESFFLFLPSLYPLLRTRASIRQSLLRLGTMIVASSAVFFWLHLRFRFNPGGVVEIHLREQFFYFLNVGTWLYPSEVTYGLLLPPACNPIFLALVAWTTWRGWGLLPAYMKRHAQIAAMINVPLYFLFCLPGELRDLSFLYVALVLLIAANIARSSQSSNTFVPVVSNRAPAGSV